MEGIDHWVFETPCLVTCCSDFFRPDSPEEFAYSCREKQGAVLSFHNDIELFLCPSNTSYVQEYPSSRRLWRVDNQKKLTPGSLGLDSLDWGLAEWKI